MLSPGALARRVLGERGFVRAAALYRRIFVDLDAMVDCLPAPPPGAEILDVGGGDGALLDRLLARHPDARATLVDLAASVGIAIAPERRARVRLLPATQLAAARAAGAPRPDWIMLSDVLHHVPRAEREALLREVRAVAAGGPLTLIVKEVAPGGLRSRLAVWADRWVSGDRGVVLLAPAEARALVTSVWPDCVAHETGLLERDRPNYCVVFRLGGAAAPTVSRVAAHDTQSREYTARLERLEGARWKRWLPVQAPYRWNLRRLGLGRTLEIGCGIGRNLRHLAPGSVGVEPNLASVEVARRRGCEAMTPEAFRAAPREPFDALLTAHVLEHMRRVEAEALVAEYLPCVRRGGLVVLITPQEAGFRSDASHVELLDHAALGEILRRVGCEVLRSYSFPFPRVAGRFFPHNEFVVVGRRAT